MAPGLNARGRRRGPSDELRVELQAKAKAAGLLVPHLPQAYGGHGLNHRQTATVFRAAGYSLLGPVAMNIMAPDEGNMYLLDQVGTHEQKAHFLRPLAAGETRSAFFLTEPAGGAGTSPLIPPDPPSPANSAMFAGAENVMLDVPRTIGFAVVTCQ